MRNSPLTLLSSLLLVPAGLCLPHAFSGLEGRATTPVAPPKDACVAGPVKDKTAIWVARDGATGGLSVSASLSIQVHVEVEQYKGYFIVAADLESEGVWPGTNRISLKDKTDVDIQPFWDTGLTPILPAGQTALDGNFSVWINSDAAKTANYAQDSVEYDWPGMWPRFDMSIDTKSNTGYFVVKFMNPAQGVTTFAVENITSYLCGTSQ